jgi:regulator of sigma E protease
VFEILPAAVRTPLAFVIVLGILVFVHELGHYLAARWRGVHVEVFSIGFGRPWLTWTDGHKTVWKLAWIPLGGYVKLHGQERPEDVPADVRAGWLPGRTFHEKSVLSRAIVVAAGPLANFLLAIVLFSVLYAAVGRPVSMPVVGEVVPGSAAQAAGLQPGDRITSIDGQGVTTFEDIQAIVTTHPNVRLMLHVERNGARLDLPATPTLLLSGEKQVGMLGIRNGGGVYKPVPLLEAVPAGIAQTWTVTAQTLAGVWEMLTAQHGTADLGGPLRIAQLSGEVAQYGLASLVSFIAVLSVNLGLINLFPIPILDGGHLLFFLAEAVRGRPLPARAQEYGLRAGFALLIGLFVFATWNDLSHIGLFRWVASLRG